MKWAVARKGMGMCGEALRLPLTSLTAQNRPVLERPCAALACCEHILESEELCEFRFQTRPPSAWPYP